jgi:PKD repeat protein/type 1 glutamine amidotransferase
MQLHARRWVSLGVGSLLALSMAGLPSAQSATNESSAQAAVQAAAVVNPSVLVFHGAPGEQDDPVAQALAAFQQIGSANGLTVDSSSNPAVFTAANLAKYRGVVFLSADGIELSEEQEAALQTYIRAGNGFLGVKDAAKAQVESSWFTGLIGARPAGAVRAYEAPESVTATVGSRPSPSGELPPNLIDGNTGTKWLTFANTGAITLKLKAPAVASAYAIGSANDSEDRDPQDWTIEGSTDGTTWVTLDSRTGQDFPQRFQMRTFDIANNTTAYQWYRMNITRNSGAAELQQSEFQIFGPEPTEGPPPIPTQEAVVEVVDRQHPANEGLGLTWTRSDKWTNWQENPTGTVHTIAQVRETSYDPGESAMGAFHPISWCRDYDGGRSFYTGMGGTPESYSEAEFRSHLEGALLWSTGMVRGDCKATIGSNYTIERLTATNQPNQLDQIGEPHGLTIDPDSGKVFYIGKAACRTAPIVPWDNPNVGLGCGTIHEYDPATKQVKLLTTLAVMGHRGGGTELQKNEEGLVGIVTDPNFSENGWIYVYWMPHESIDRERHVGMRTISRFTYDAEAKSIDQATRVDLLEWETQIHSCCHAGGGMAFDAEGNLYVGTGDSNSSGGSSGYSGNNWTQEFGGYSFQDARRTSGNTNDLNGKMLRITPQADGTYTIPEGNLFTGNEEGGGKTRPEIYVMGVRNISRLQVDPDTQWVTTGWVGPDAANPHPELGPAKYETATIITSAGNQGWPYCMGNKQPYRNRSNTDANVLTNWYDCDNLVNDSPRNTGLVNIPPARTNMMWYAPSGGGPVFPTREVDGRQIPTYDLADVIHTQPYLRGGGQAVMSGPTYRQSQLKGEAGKNGAWPSYWEGKWLIGDYQSSANRIAVTVDPETVEEQGPPAFAEDIRSIIRPGNTGTTLQNWMDAKFGPDGALYMLDYSTGFFSLTNNQKLIRVAYTGGEATPLPRALSRASGDNPLRYEFTGSRSGGVSWLWNFGDGRTSTEADPVHTYARAGDYTATLTVTYADGTTETSSTQVSIGGYVPLFDGSAASLEGWEMAGPGSWSITDEGNLRSSGGLGMLWYAAHQFKDFSLKLQFRDMAPGNTRANSGAFVRFPDPRTPLAQRPECGRTGSAASQPAWVAIYCGHEIQIYDGTTGEPQKTGSVYNFDPVTSLEAAGATPKGEWNDYEIRVVGQHYTMIRNGVVINEFDNTPGKSSSRGGDPSTTLRQFLEGFIGLQNHGNADVIEMRNIGIRYINPDFDSINDTMEIYRNLDRLAGHVQTSLLDRLDRARDAAAAGSEARTIAFLQQFVGRAKNQVKGDAQDIEVRNQLVAMAEELIEKYQAMDDAENAR